MLRTTLGARPSAERTGAALGRATTSARRRGETLLAKPPQPASSAAPGTTPGELDLLEQTVSLEGPIAEPRETHGLEPAPIPSAWILDGDPLAREKALAHSTDGTATAYMWDCTGGRFQWEYPAEEIVHVLQGCAIVEIAGVSRRLHSGDTHVFPAGSRFRWTVPDYVRTVTLRLRSPRSGPLGRRLQAALARNLSAARRG